MRAVVFILLVLLGLVVLADDHGPRSAIEDTTTGAGFHRADAPAWKPPSPEDNRLFATCPTAAPWARPHHVEEQAV